MKVLRVSLQLARVLLMIVCIILPPIGLLVTLPLTENNCPEEEERTWEK